MTMRDDELLNDVLASKLAPFDDRYRDTTERDRDLDHPTELGDCEVRMCEKPGIRRPVCNDAIKIETIMDDGYKMPVCAECQSELSDCVAEARSEGANMLTYVARAVALFKRASVPALFVAAAILQQVVCQ